MSNFLFTPANDSQRRAISAFKTNDILALTGIAGTGKTHVALGLAAQHAVQYKARIIVSRPYVSACESMGFLPGRLEQKMHPFLMPLHDVLRRMTFEKPEEWIKANTEVCPLAFMRGRTFDRCVAVLDEAQNATYEQLLMFLTRIGDRGKLILSGDVGQSDRDDSGLRHVLSRIEHVSGVAVVDLSGEANVRHAVIPRLVQALS